MKLKSLFKNRYSIQITTLGLLGLLHLIKPGVVFALSTAEATDKISSISKEIKTMIVNPELLLAVIVISLLACGVAAAFGGPWRRLGLGCGIAALIFAFI